METSMTDTHMPASSTPTARLSRRSLLRGSVTLGLVALAGGLGPWQSVMAEGDQDFIALSQFLVSRPVNPVLAARYYRALSRRAPNFSGNVGALKQLVDGQGFKHVDEYLAQANPDPSLKATATSIISAWYLGIVGELADAELISYSEALMYRPTHGILIIPTYGGGPESWGAKPADTQDFKL
ncbi:sorbitol dehydrogenase family protein [Pseudomonas sp. Pdm06]|uniref:sorbitol dehydrogenase family protein n=1 Tax=Pseudomonas sp. Pdm06 TaxID=1790044 RepID=UPI00177F8D48|nr:sorbitol dehydrogenase family protein [Pseudomonas sp. Pdm06]MBD9465871.1 sorbitol dehydrogenase family protein [Pseudomonas sp. Pdm06]